MEATNTVNKRMNWLDWMKAIGMYLIIYGHFTSYGHKFIYTFSAPLFFIMSGFLFKKEECFRTFIKKNLYNLLLPMIIMIILVQIRNNASYIVNGTFTFEQFQHIVIGFLIGNQKMLGACWFIYTLFIIKLILQILPGKKLFRIILLLLFSVGSIILSKNGIFARNAIVNVLLSYPFFFAGILFKEHKPAINNGFDTKYSIIVFFATSTITYLCSRYNGNVWVFINDYGKSFLLYLLGGLSGTALIYIICKWLDNLNSSIVSTISTGSIVILGLHFSLIRYFKIYYETDWISALVILLLFVPIIKFCEKRLPILIGIYRLNRDK